MIIKMTMKIMKCLRRIFQMITRLNRIMEKIREMKIILRKSNKMIWTCLGNQSPRKAINYLMLKNKAQQS